MNIAPVAQEHKFCLSCDCKLWNFNKHGLCSDCKDEQDAILEEATCLEDVIDIILGIK